MIQENQQSNDAETPFNYAMLYFIRLNKTIEKKDFGYIDGDIIVWFKGLKVILRAIPFRYIKDKKEELLKKFRTAKQFLNEGDKEKASEVLEEIDFALTDIMDTKHMIFPNIEATGGLDKLRRSYGLKDDEK